MPIRQTSRQARFAGPEPSSARSLAQPVALMPRTRPLAAGGGGGDEDLNRLIEKYATLYEVPVQLVRRVVKRESNFHPGAYNGGHWGLIRSSTRRRAAWAMTARRAACSTPRPTSNTR